MNCLKVFGFFNRFRGTCLYFGILVTIFRILNIRPLILKRLYFFLYHAYKTFAPFQRKPKPPINNTPTLPYNTPAHSFTKMHVQIESSDGVVPASALTSIRRKRRTIIHCPVLSSACNIMHCTERTTPTGRRDRCRRTTKAWCLAFERG